jgi:hypothetical protein
LSGRVFEFVSGHRNDRDLAKRRRADAGASTGLTADIHSSAPAMTLNVRVMAAPPSEVAIMRGTCWGA